MRPATRPLLLGHRGARATASVPENTLASFDLCLQQGCDGFEFDVRGTADGAAVVCHDADFRGLGLSETASSDLVFWQEQGFLPELGEVLRRYGPLCFLDIEIKVAGIEARVLELLRLYPPRRGFVVTSFLPEVLAQIRTLDATIELGFLWDQATDVWRDIAVSWTLPELDLMDAELASSLRAAGKRIGVWTVNRPGDMIRAADLGAEILIADDTVGLVNAFPVG